MTALTDITGQTFNRIEVLERAGSTAHGKPTWKCRCHCGRITTLPGRGLRDGKTKHCGCLGGVPHGENKSRLYHVWKGMKVRCYRKGNAAFKAYGAKGITICDEWLVAANFFAWAKANGYREDRDIDRINAARGYSPDNCRFVDRSENRRRTSRTRFVQWRGRELSIPQVAAEVGIPDRTLFARVFQHGIPLEDAVNLGDEPWATRRYLAQRR